MLSSHTASLDEIAAAMGRDPAWLMRNWRRLHRRHGFPRKIPGGWAFPRLAVETWLRTAGQSPAPLAAANANQPAGGDYVAAYADRLRNRSNQ